MADELQEVKTTEQRLRAVESELARLRAHVGIHDARIQLAMAASGDPAAPTLVVSEPDKLTPVDAAAIKEFQRKLSDQQALLIDTNAFAHELSAKERRLAHDLEETQKDLAKCHAEIGASAQVLKDALEKTGREHAELKETLARATAEQARENAAMKETQARATAEQARENAAIKETQARAAAEQARQLDLLAAGLRRTRWFAAILAILLVLALLLLAGKVGSGAVRGMIRQAAVENLKHERTVAG